MSDQPIRVKASMEDCFRALAYCYDPALIDREQVTDLYERGVLTDTETGPTLTPGGVEAVKHRAVRAVKWHAEISARRATVRRAEALAQGHDLTDTQMGVLTKLSPPHG